MAQHREHRRCAVFGHAGAARTVVYVHAMMASAKSAQKFGATIRRRIPAPPIVAAILSVIILGILADYVGQGSAGSFPDNFAESQKRFHDGFGVPEVEIQAVERSKN